MTASQIARAQELAKEFVENKEKGASPEKASRQSSAEIKATGQDFLLREAVVC